jgi:hypothetical protein
MSTFITIPSVCGATNGRIDVQDWELNKDGIRCCSNCESILLCRKAWDFLYKKGGRK